MKIIRTDSSNQDFISLISKLDLYLQKINGETHSFYNQYNKVDSIKNVVIIYMNDKPAGCGAFKKFDETTCEIKRMFTDIRYRGKGVAGTVVEELEKWAKELCYQNVILETSVRLDNAINLYKRKGYHQVPNYGQYINIADSMCFKKSLF